jgi:hypothetical protein
MKKERCSVLPLTVYSNTNNAINEINVMMESLNESSDLKLKRYFISSGANGATETIVLIISIAANIAAIIDFLSRYLAKRNNGDKAKIYLENKLIQKNNGSIVTRKSKTKIELNSNTISVDLAKIVFDYTTRIRIIEDD